MRNRYIQLGWGLLLTGAALTPTSHLLLRSIPITALGFSLVIIGAICLVLGRTIPKIPPEVSKLLMETGLENLGSLLEELGIRSKGIYLPSSLAAGKPRAIIPLYSKLDLPEIRGALPQRLIEPWGRSTEDVGILVTTTGSNIMEMLEVKPRPNGEEIAAALTTLLVGTLSVASGVGVDLDDARAAVGVSHPYLEYKNSWLQQTLGSPIASIVSSIVAEALGRPVIIKGEESKRGEKLIELEFLNVVH